MTVHELAAQLGITPREVVALCVVAGVKVTGPDQVFTPDEVAALQRVLSGQQAMKDPTRGRQPPPKPKVPPGDPIRRRRPVWPWIVGVLVVGFIGLSVFLGSVLGGTPSITVQAGDCFDATLLGSTVFGTSIEPEPCDDATYRAFAVLDLEEVFTSWPGADAVEARARDRCSSIALQSDVESSFIYYFGPSDEASWDSPTARKVVCAVKT